MLSLEAVGVDTEWVARRRATAPPDPGGSPVVSDILLFAPTELLPESLEAVLPAVLRAPLVPGGGRVGLYWEMYGELDAKAPVDVTVTAMELASRQDAPYPLGRPSCPFGAESPVRLRWREEAGARARGPGRAVALDLQALHQGDYVVTIQAGVGGRTRGCSSRELRLGREE